MRNWVVFSSGQKWTFRIVFTCFFNCYVLYFSPMQSSFCNLSSNGSSILFFCNGRLILSLEQTSLFKLFSQYLSKERKIFLNFFLFMSKKVFPISDDENKYNTWIFGKGIFGRKQAQNCQKGGKSHRFHPFCLFSNKWNRERTFQKKKRSIRQNKVNFCGHHLRNSIEFIIKDVSGTGKQVKNKLIDEKIQNDIYIFVVFMQHVCFRKLQIKKTEHLI